MCGRSVFGESLLSPSEKLAWTVCMLVIADTVQHIAAEVNVKAICHVDEDSGLPQYPISGNIAFSQGVRSLATSVRRDLRHRRLYINLYSPRNGSNYETQKNTAIQDYTHTRLTHTHV